MHVCLPPPPPVHAHSPYDPLHALRACMQGLLLLLPTAQSLAATADGPLPSYYRYCQRRH